MLYLCLITLNSMFRTDCRNHVSYYSLTDCCEDAGITFTSSTFFHYLTSIFWCVFMCLLFCTWAKGILIDIHWNVAHELNVDDCCNWKSVFFWCNVSYLHHFCLHWVAVAYCKWMPAAPQILILNFSFTFWTHKLNSSSKLCCMVMFTFPYWSSTKNVFVYSPVDWNQLLFLTFCLQLVQIFLAQTWSTTTHCLKSTRKTIFWLVFCLLKSSQLLMKYRTYASLPSKRWEICWLSMLLMIDMHQRFVLCSTFLFHLQFTYFSALSMVSFSNLSDFGFYQPFKHVIS